MTHSYDWTSARVEQLVQLVLSGEHSYAKIAKIMGCESRNIPLCKFNRLRAVDPSLAAKTPPRTVRPTGSVDSAPRSRVRVVPAEAVVEKLEPVLIGGNVISFEQAVSRMCRYPHGDPCQPGFHICGHVPKAGSAYCEVHHRECYQPLKPKAVKKPFSNRVSLAAIRDFSSEFEH